MVCIEVLSSGSRNLNTQFWDDILEACEAFVFLHEVKDWPPFTEAYKVKIDGQEKIYYVEMPRF